MRDIPMKRILRLYLATFIVLFIVANFLSNTARANDIGSIPVTFSQTKAYQEPVASDVANMPNWSVIVYDSANVNYISDIRITSLGGIFLTISFVGVDFDSSRFSCWANCSGGGWFYFQNVSGIRTIKYVFDSDFVFTRSPIRLNYERNVWSNISITSGGFGDGGIITNLTRPACVQNDIGNNHCLILGYNTTITGGTTDAYNVSYTGSSAFVNITKGGTANSKWTLLDGNGTMYINETTFNKINKVLPITINNGVYANVSIETGDFTFRIINATAWSGFVAPPDVPTTDPVTGVGMIFDAATYSIGGTANISWIRNVSTPFGYQDDIYLTQPGSIKKILVSSPADSGFVKTNDFPVAGKYEVTFERSVLGLFPTTLASDNATVIAVQPSYIIINSTIPSNYPFNFTWLLGYTPALQTITNGVEIYQISSGWLVSSCYNLNIVANTEYTCNATVPAAGDYKVVLRDIAKGNVVTVFTKAVDGYKPPAKNITVSSLSIDKTAYFRGDDMKISFEIDNANYSNYMTFYSFWNKTLNKNMANYKLDGQQFGNTDNVLGTYADSWDFKRTLSGSGTYNISLMAKNNTAEFVITFVNFTYTDANRRGLSLSLKNKTICANEAQIFTYVLTENVTLRIQESSSGKTVASYNLSESGSLRYTTTKTGVYLVSLQARGDGTLQILDDYTVTGCVAIPVATPISGAGQAQQVASMITTPIFWALIVTAGLMIAIAWKTKDSFASGSVGMLSAGVFAYMTWLPLWIFFSVLIIAALLLSSSVVAKQLKKTG